MLDNLMIARSLVYEKNLIHLVLNALLKMMKMRELGDDDRTVCRDWVHVVWVLWYLIHLEEYDLGNSYIF